MNILNALIRFIGPQSHICLLDFWHSNFGPSVVQNPVEMDPDPTTPPAPQRKRKQELTEKQRERAIFMLKGMLKDGVLPRGSLSKVAKVFGARNDTIGILWRGVVANEAQGLSNSPAIRSKRHLRGAKAIYNIDELAEALKLVPRKQRKTTRAAASALGVSTFMIQEMKKKKIVWKHYVIA